MFRRVCVGERLRMRQGDMLPHFTLPGVISQMIVVGGSRLSFGSGKAQDHFGVFLYL